MKLSIEVKSEDKTTIYSVDLDETEKAIESATDGVKSFLKKTFTKETKESLV